MVKIRFNRFQLSVFFLCVGVFVLPSSLRGAISDSPYMEINFIALAALCCIYLNNIKKPACISAIETNKWLEKWCVLSLILLLITFVILTVKRKDYESCLAYFVMLIFPALFSNFEFKDSAIFKGLVKVWMIFLHGSAIFMLVCSLGDILFENYVSLFFTNLYQITSLFNSVQAGRMVSYMGHPLLSCELFLIYYATYYLYTTKYLQKREKIYPVLISLLGIALTGSKAGIVLILAAVILFHANWQGQKIVPFALLGILLLYGLGLFDLVIERLRIGFQSGDITTTRNTALTALLSRGELTFDWFSGQNIDYSWEMVAALEYPVLRWAYQFGIAVALSLTFVVFVNPVLKLLQYKVKKEWLFGIGIVAVFVNTYNGLALQRDHMLIYCVTVIFLVNMARNSKGVIEQ